MAGGPNTPPAAALTVLRSVLPEQLLAAETFGAIATQYPSRTLEAVTNYNFDRETTPTRSRVVQAVAGLFGSKADLFVEFDDAINTATARARERWMTINQSSKGSEGDEIAARNDWRRARVALYVGELPPPQPRRRSRQPAGKAL